MAQDKPDRARERLEAARGKVPSAASPWVALANLASRQGDPNKARTLIREARRTLGARFGCAWRKSSRRSDRTKKSLARSLTGAEKDLAKLSPKNNSRCWDGWRSVIRTGETSGKRSGFVASS